MKLSCNRKTSKISIILLTLIVMVCNSTITVRADNTEDLLNVYGLTLGGPIKSEMEQQLEQARQSLLNAEHIQSETDEYNRIVETVLQQRQENIDNTFVAIQQYTTKNDTIATNIETNLLDGSIDELILLDNNYKTNENYMNQLLDGLSYYTATFSYKETNIDFDQLQSNLVTAQNLYAESVDTFELGDVKNIQFIMPVERRINSAYGLRIDPLNTSRVRFHAGTDYRASTGTPVGALFNGTVTSCGWSNEIGYFVVVQSGENIRYMICHCSELCVENGQQVSQYQTLAYSGGTGTMCTGPHLHMALYINGASYDVDKLFQ